jgi:hypothetical protein
VVPPLCDALWPRKIFGDASPRTQGVTNLARLDYPDASDVAEVMREFPPPLRNMNIGRMVSHAPTLVGPYSNTHAAALQWLELDPKLRQLAILRLAGRGSAPYVLTQQIEPEHPLGHGVIAMLRIEQAKRSGELAAGCAAMPRTIVPHSTTTCTPRTVES